MRISYHAEDQRPRIGSEGRDRGGGRRGEEARNASEELSTRGGKRGRVGWEDEKS